MFDAVLQGSRVKSRWGSGAAVTVLAHVAVIGIVIELGRRRIVEEDKPPQVVFVKPQPPQAPPPPPPPPPPAPKKTQTKVVKQELPKEAVIQPKEIPPEPPPEEPAPEPAGEEAGEEGGVEGGVVGGVKGGVVGGQVGGVLGGTGPVRMVFNDKMPPIKKVAGPDPEYTQQALDREIQGTMVVRCIIGTTGEVRECQIVKGLPFLDAPTLAALNHRRYQPVIVDGRAVEVEYTFKIPFVLPEE